MDSDPAPDEDLAGGELDSNKEKEVSAQLALDTQRFWFRIILFVFTLFAASFLGYVFFELEHAVSKALEAAITVEVHWPVLALCSVTLLGASALVHSVMRFVFRPEASKDKAGSDGFELPQLELIKQAVELLKVARGTTKEKE